MAPTNGWSRSASWTSASRTGVAADQEHVFPFTSITKPFTAVQVLTLVDDGRLDLHAPVCEYIPEFGSPTKRR